MVNSIEKGKRGEREFASLCRHEGYDVRRGQQYNGIEKAKEMLDGDDMPLLFGPSHLVWEDGNMGDGHIDYCLEYDTGELNSKQIKAVHWSLNELKKVPLSVRNKVSS